MRTTITLDNDVEHLLKEEAYRLGESFKKALNETVRYAFRMKRNPLPSLKPFVVKARPMSLRPGIDPARLSELADEMETEAFLAVKKRTRTRRKKR